MTSSPELIAFGQAVKAERLSREWTLELLAHHVLGQQERKSYCSQVERGLRNLSAITINKFANALDLSKDVVNPLLGLPLPNEDERTVEDDSAETLVAKVDALTEKLKLSEALAVALAYKYAEGNPTDIEGALKGLEAALETAAQDQARGALSSNLGEAVDDIVRHIDKMNKDGEIDAADDALEEDLARRRAERERQQAEDTRILEKAITQATYTRNAERLAERTLELVQLNAPSREDQFHQLRNHFNERYNEGLHRGTPFALEAAIGIARKCASIAPSPALKAAASNDVAVAISNKGMRTAGPEGAELFAEAVGAFKSALSFYTETEHPQDWATTQNNLGCTLQEQGTRTAGRKGTDLLIQAVAAYCNALIVRTEAIYPLDWADTSNNLGTALRDQGIRTTGPESLALFARAVDAYRAALSVYTEDGNPWAWATTQNNFGIALQGKGVRTAGPEGAEILASGIAAYREALRVRTKSYLPVDWAATQNNLGGALANQAERVAGECGAVLFAEAVTAWSESLDVFNEADHPLNWAMTQNNLAIAHLSLANHDTTPNPRPHLETALTHVEAALTVFDPEHMSYNHDEATRVRNHIRDRLAALD